MTLPNFAAFVVTHNRPIQVTDTIMALLRQSYAPSKILVIDNGTTQASKLYIESLERSEISYHHMGFNAGPAGAAEAALIQLAGEGYEWIFWGDDNDPPKFDFCFERLLNNNLGLAKPGIVGAVGHRLNRITGTLTRTPDKSIAANTWISVDNVAGGMCMIVNANVVKSGALPDPSLFYGFEELDFCLRVKHAGFRVWVNCELFTLYRANSRRPLTLAGKRGLKKKEENLWREYYSTRNLLVIARKNRLLLMMIMVLLRSVAKCVYSLRYGLSYSITTSKYVFVGISHFILNKSGKRNFK